jgi:hypothetical protein
MTYMKNENEKDPTLIISENVHRCSDKEQEEFLFTLLGVVSVKSPECIEMAARFVSEKLSEKLQKPLDEAQ